MKEPIECLKGERQSSPECSKYKIKNDCGAGRGKTKIAAVSQEQLQRMIDKWQERLKLQEWTIEAGIIHGLKDCYAKISYDRYAAIAHLVLLDPEEALAMQRLQPYDPEHAILHELIHLRLADCAIEHSPQEERAVNAMASALLRLDREAEGILISS